MGLAADADNFIDTFAGAHRYGLDEGGPALGGFIFCLLKSLVTYFSHSSFSEL